MNELDLSQVSTKNLYKELSKRADFDFDDARIMYDLCVEGYTAKDVIIVYGELESFFKKTKYFQYAPHVIIPDTGKKMLAYEVGDFTEFLPEFSEAQEGIYECRKSLEYCLKLFEKRGFKTERNDDWFKDYPWG